MSISYIDKDILLTEDFDIIIDRQKGEMRMAGNENDLLKEQVIRKRIQTNRSEFLLDTVIGANLDDLIGLPLKDFMNQIIIANITQALLIDGAFDPKEISVSYMDVTKKDVFINITLNGNRLRDDKSIYGFNYNTEDNKVIQRF